MDVKQRMYYFDGKSILLDNIDETNKFDQTFDDAKQSQTLQKTEKDLKNNFFQSNNSFSGNMQNMSKFVNSNEEFGRIIYIYNIRNLPV